MMFGTIAKIEGEISGEFQGALQDQACSSGSIEKFKVRFMARGFSQ